MVSVVASRYARALVDVVFEPGSKADPAVALAQLRAFEQLVESSPGAAQRAAIAGGRAGAKARHHR